MPAVLVYLHIEGPRKIDLIWQHALKLRVIPDHEDRQHGDSSARQARLPLRDKISAFEPRGNVLCHKRKIVQLGSKQQIFDVTDEVMRSQIFRDQNGLGSVQITSGRVQTEVIVSQFTADDPALRWFVQTEGNVSFALGEAECPGCGNQFDMQVWDLVAKDSKPRREKHAAEPVGGTDSDNVRRQLLLAYIRSRCQSCRLNDLRRQLRPKACASAA